MKEQTKTNKNDQDSLAQRKQEQQNYLRQEKEKQNLTSEVDKRTDGPNRPST